MLKRLRQVGAKKERNLEYESFRGVATVFEPILPNQKGRIRFKASWWKALSDGNHTILPGAKVEVLKRENLTLIVKPIV